LGWRWLQWRRILRVCRVSSNLDFGIELTLAQCGDKIREHRLDGIFAAPSDFQGKLESICGSAMSTSQISKLTDNNRYDRGIE
jgi:hypothetical protein